MNMKAILHYSHTQKRKQRTGEGGGEKKESKGHSRITGCICIYLFAYVLICACVYVYMCVLACILVPVCVYVALK